ncbi:MULTISPECIES: hypothetical protein [Gammaproteobacteria]|jgi:hypothetical protein|uniref:hypothetical protein n=1 Tax=Gammaproteobacteria TaxID=1236 RepID=UPI0012380384|nr:MULTISPECIES: hypothetical protein [Gammaproteobacteria]MEA3379341.1 hypothetical protein [Pseudomonadota bacterium]|tara:strand:- start:2482 stop:2694 length:213 start_codon:yes stop_codon:yes gene_type:complete
MEILMAGFGLLLSLVLLGALIFTFQKSDELIDSNKHFAGHKKILTRDGMVVKKSELGEPLYLLGDSKNIG